MWATSGQNVELEHFTQALYDARELAMARMQAEARALDAEGIVGVQLEQATPGGPHDRVLRDRDGGAAAAPDHVVPAPQLVLGLEGWPGPDGGPRARCEIVTSGADPPVPF